MKKKLFVIFMALILAFLFTACGGSGTGSSGSSLAPQEDGAANGPDDGMVSVYITTEGIGQIAYATDGGEIAFNDEEPIESAQLELPAGTELTLAAQTGGRWGFAGWALNGEIFSEEEQVTVTVEDDSDYVAIFEE